MSRALSLPDDYIDARTGSIGVAAAALLAVGTGRLELSNDEDVRGLLAQRSIPDDAALRQAAQSALDRLAGDDSELWDLWQEADVTDEVSATYDEIRAALRD